jgi:hypothetical protein
MGVCCDLSLILETRLNNYRQEHSRMDGGTEEVLMSSLFQLTKRRQDCVDSVFIHYFIQREQKEFDTCVSSC